MITVAPNMMYTAQEKAVPHSHGTRVDVVPTTVGIPSTLNPSPRYCTTVNFNPISAVIPQIPLPSHSLHPTHSPPPFAVLPSFPFYPFPPFPPLTLPHLFPNPPLPSTSPSSLVPFPHIILPSLRTARGQGRSQEFEWGYTF